MLVKDYIIIGLAFLVICSLSLAGYYDRKYTTERDSRVQFEFALNTQNAQLLANRAEYEANLVKAEEHRVITQNIYRDRNHYITTFQGDANETDLRNVYIFLRDFNISGV